MKKICILMIFACSSIWATNKRIEQVIHTFSNRTINDRVYLKAENVYLTSESILLMIEDDLVPISAIHSDENGIYVDAEYLGTLEHCSTCNRWYDPERQYVICPHNFRKG